MAFARAKFRTVPPQPFAVEGFTDIRDQRSPSVNEQEMLYHLNFVRERADRPSALFLRPGFKRYLFSDAPGASFALRADTAGGIQWSGRTVFAAGATKFILVSGPTVYSIGTVAGTAVNPALTTQLTNAQIVAAGATSLSGGVLTGVVAFHNKLIFCTSTGKPWSWDGTVGGGITVLANAPTGTYFPVIYGAKLFVSDGAVTLYWSEENDETTGYASGGFNNTWAVTQSNQTPIIDMLATEERLILLRVQGIASVRGNVDANFKTTATRDDISSSYNHNALTNCPARASYGKGGTMLFFDGAAHPLLLRGNEIVPLWQQVARWWGPQSGAADSTGAPVMPDRQPFQFASLDGIGEIGSGAGAGIELSALACWYDPTWNTNVYALYDFQDNAILLHFDADADRLVSIWRRAAVGGNVGFAFCSIGESISGLSDTIMADGSGYLFWTDNAHINTTGSYYNDESQNGPGLPVPGVIAGPPHGWNHATEYHWERADVIVDDRASLHITFGWLTSEQHKGALATAVQTPTDETGNTNSPYERRVEFGLDALGRWLRPSITVQAVTATDLARLGIFGYRLLARPLAPRLGGF